MKKKKTMPLTPTAKPSKTPPKVKPITKGIDKMTVEELKAALKKRKIKGLTGMKKEELVKKLKNEVRTQRTIGGGVMKKKPGVGGAMEGGGGVGEEQGEVPSRSSMESKEGGVANSAKEIEKVVGIEPGELEVTRTESGVGGAPRRGCLLYTSPSPRDS